MKNRDRRRSSHRATVAGLSTCDSWSVGATGRHDGLSRCPTVTPAKLVLVLGKAVVVLPSQVGDATANSVLRHLTAMKKFSYTFSVFRLSARGLRPAQPQLNG